jgi:hypothetical protein
LAAEKKDFKPSAAASPDDFSVNFVSPTSTRIADQPNTTWSTCKPVLASLCKDFSLRNVRA